MFATPEKQQQGTQILALLVTSALILGSSAQPATAAGAGLHGRVFGMDDQGKFVGMVGQAKIVFKNPAGAVAAQTISGATGYYRVDLQPGRYLYEVTAEGYKDERHGRGVVTQSQDYATFNLSLTKGTTTSEPEPTPPPEELGRLSGRVLGQTDSGPRVGLGGAVIKIRQVDALRLQSVTTAPGTAETAGRYEVLLPAGTYRAAVSATDFESLVDPNPIVIEPSVGTTRNFLLKRSLPVDPIRQGIRGLVSLQSIPGKPATSPAKAIVSITALSNPQQPAHRTIPAEDGTFAAELPSGAYQVVAQAEGYQPARRSLAIVFAGRYTVVNLRLGAVIEEEEPPVFDVLVRVFEKLKAETRPLSGAKVLVHKRGGPFSAAVHGETNSAGEVTLRVTEAGNYAVLAQKPKYRPAGVQVRIGPDESNLAEITMQPEQIEDTKPITVAGYVVYRDAKSPTGLRGVAGSQMSWQRTDAAGRPKLATSGTVGRFNIDLSPGVYDVEVRPPAGFVRTREKVVVRQGMKPVYFVLQQIEDIDGFVALNVTVRRAPEPLKRTSLALSGARIEILQRGRIIETGSSDTDGNYSFRLKPGSYEMAVSYTGYVTARQKVTLAQDTNRTVYLRRQATALSLNLRVMERIQIGPRQVVKPLPGAAIQINQQGRPVASGKSGKTGAYSVSLKPGAYQVGVSMSGHTSAQESVMLVAGNVSRDIVLTRLSDGDLDRKRTLTLRIVERTIQPIPQVPGTSPQPQPRSRLRKPAAALDVTPKLPAQKEPAGKSTLSRIEQLRSRLQTKPGVQQQLRPQPLRPAIVKPVTGATITITLRGKPVATGVSNSDGMYQVRLDRGSYQVEVQKKLYETVRQPVTISTRDVTRQIVLPKLPMR